MGQLQKNNNEHLNLVKKIAERMGVNTFEEFVEALQAQYVSDPEKLAAALLLLSFFKLGELLESAYIFFEGRIDFDCITLEELEAMDLKQLSKDFAKHMAGDGYSEFTKEQRDLIRSAFGELAQEFLHKVVFPALIETNPAAATAVKNLIVRSTIDICREQQISLDNTFDLLKINELPNAAPLKRIDSATTITEPPVFENYMMCGGPITDNAAELVVILQTQHGTFNRGWKAFEDLLTKHSGDCGYVYFKSKDKLRLVLRIIYCLKHPELNPWKKRMIKLRKGNGEMNFLYDYFIEEETGMQFKRDLHSISSETNKNKKLYAQIHIDAQDVLKQIFSKNNSNETDD